MFLFGTYGRPDKKATCKGSLQVAHASSLLRPMVTIVILGGVGIHADLTNQIFDARELLFGAQKGEQV